MATVQPRETATERAYAFTKSRVLDGRFAGGDLISEGDVAASVGLSRTPVREAFLQLESEGLLRLYPKRGALVVPVSAAEVEDVMETRLLVERFAIEKIGRAAPGLIAQLQAEIERQERLAARGDARAFVVSDREFHRLLVAATGNQVLLTLHDSLRDRQSRMGLVALAADADRVREICAEHRALLTALAAGDPAAGDLMTAHLQRTLALVRRERSAG
ncbi:GntR family transcriptional regulator [Conexibacter sp. CPCC 206217]|uniref:GntR family transcriptional regulator n=1 Tax=Conexibacter sp. CPCC 206217 TaxID=3064574 RepID=UPI002726B37B|nr:GntR family transcriptional regulator [Conexibacter sp. CPCC 206217]MDO8211074.1 GntR family transcriptional regulator [Conexibacter sp. CPCC 206217]